MTFIAKLYRRVLLLLSLPVLLREYFRGTTGIDYGITFGSKLGLVWKMMRNNRQIPTASHFLEHLCMATRIMNVPKRVKGCVVECGCFKGGSTANLSLVCALCNRELEVFDSFEGLPEPAEEDKTHLLVDAGEVHTYAKGGWAGSFEEVRRNVATGGVAEICHLNKGFFNDSLPGFDKPVILAFIDVDLVSSLETCLRYIWPQLQDGCAAFTHEATHREIAAFFFDSEWWRENMQSEAPGLIGAGNGLGLLPGDVNGYRSDIGYALKHPESLRLRTVPQ